MLISTTLFGVLLLLDVSQLKVTVHVGLTEGNRIATGPALSLPLGPPSDRLKFH